MPPNQFWYCTMANYFLFSFTLISAYLITSMTFDRFYSILKPHKAASMNTIRRARITVFCIVIISLFFNIPHWFLSTALNGKFCQPFHLHMNEWYNGAYFWLYMVLSYVIPFVCLLIMNSCVIYYINKSAKNAKFSNKNEGNSCQGQDEAEICEEEGDRQITMDIQRTRHLSFQRKSLQTRGKNSEIQIYFILLSVTFAFLILTFPAYAYFFYTRVYSGTSEIPRSSALWFFVAQLAHKLYYTNNGINFFLYVLSGRKFRKDVLKLCSCDKNKVKGSNMSFRSRITDISSVSAVEQPQETSL